MLASHSYTYTWGVWRQIRGRQPWLVVCSCKANVIPIMGFYAHHKPVFFVICSLSSHLVLSQLRGGRHLVDIIGDISWTLLVTQT